MEVNSTIIALLVLAILVFVYFVIKRNRKDQKDLESELNQKEIKVDKHDGEKI